MSSEQCESESILEKFENPSFFQEIDSHLPDILEFLKRNYFHSEFPIILRYLFKDAVEHYELDSIQEIFLQNLLEVSKRVFQEALNSILRNLESYGDGLPSGETICNLEDLLNASLHILDGYLLLLSELLNQQKTVEAMKLNSVPRNLVFVVHEAISHCRDSESNYGVFFTSCAEKLAVLFKKSFEVQTNLMKLLEEKLIFDCSLEDDLALLVEVLEKLSGVGGIVVGLELKASVDQWKVFAKLACRYSNQLKQRLDLVVPIASMANTLQRIIISLTSQEPPMDEISQTRYLKLGNFVLKIVIKLCELYSGYLGDCHKHLLELLINLHKSDQYIDESTELYSGFRSYLSVGSLPLLTHLISDHLLVREFKKVSSNLSILTSDAKVGVYALLISIIRKLLKCEYDVQSMWLREDLVLSILYVVRDCSDEVLDPIKCDDKEGYSCMVASTALFLISVLKDDDFKKVERILFSWLCRGEFFSVLFIQDLLCILARLTKESVVMHWVTWLRHSIPTIPPSTPHLIYFQVLESRLSNFINDKKKCASFQPDQVSVDRLLHLPSSPTVNDFKKLVSDIKLVKRETCISSENMTNSLLKLWKCASMCRPESLPNEVAVKGMHWWTEFINVLSLASSELITSFSNKQLIVMFQSMVFMLSRCDSYCRLSFLHILNSLSKHIINSDEHTNEVHGMLASLLTSLLIDESDLVVYQYSLECVNSFITSLQHGEWIHGAINQQCPSLNKTLSNYQCKMLPLEDDDKNIFETSSSIFIHKCSSFPKVNVSDETSTESSMPPLKKSKTVPSLDTIISQGYSVIDNIQSYLSLNDLTVDQKSSLCEYISAVNRLKSHCK